MCGCTGGVQCNQPNREMVDYQFKKYLMLLALMSSPHSLLTFLCILALGSIGWLNSALLFRFTPSLLWPTKSVYISKVVVSFLPFLYQTAVLFNAQKWLPILNALDQNSTKSLCNSRVVVGFLPFLYQTVIQYSIAYSTHHL